MSKRDGFIAGLFLVAMMVLPFQHAAAQSSNAAPGNNAPQQNAAPSGSSAHYSDATLEKFVSAFQKVGEIRQEYIGKLQQVDDKEKAQSLQQEAGAKMTGAVEDSGLKVETYNQIAQDAQQDPQLRERIFKMADAGKRK